MVRGAEAARDSHDVGVQRSRQKDNFAGQSNRSSACRDLKTGFDSWRTSIRIGSFDTLLDIFQSDAETRLRVAKWGPEPLALRSWVKGKPCLY